MNPLPCPARPSTCPSRSHGADRPGRPRVLVVDDSQMARSLARRVLDRDFAVSEAEGGDVALQAIADKTPDVVLLDLLMPDMSGFEVLIRLRRRSTVPVIVVSGEAGESERVVALELGADDYVVKPFLARELPARVRAVLRRSQRSRPG
jgi:DNA-binding response OmpR family regulator